MFDILIMFYKGMMFNEILYRWFNDRVTERQSGYRLRKITILYISTFNPIKQIFSQTVCVGKLSDFFMYKIRRV